MTQVIGRCAGLDYLTCKQLAAERKQTLKGKGRGERRKGDKAELILTIFSSVHFVAKKMKLF